MLSLSNILFHGISLGVFFSIYALLLLRYNPRFALKDLPKEIQDMVPPLTKREKLMAGITGGPLFILFFAGLVYSTLELRQQLNGDISFLLLFVHVYSLLFISSWTELLLADFLVFCTITPKSFIIPGTEGAKGYKDYGHQFRAHVRGTFLSIPAGLIIAALVFWLKKISQ